MSDFAIPGSTDKKATELADEAQERWGDEWFLRAHIDSDGDSDVWAIHTAELVADGIVIREILTHSTSGRIVSHRALYDLEDVIADVDHD